LSISGSLLEIAPFVIRKGAQRYVSAAAISIDCARLPRDLYQVVAVHNFRAEDDNPRLDECLAGIFLARRTGARWESAEDHPVECRSIAFLGYVDTQGPRIVRP
jgi:hypothetical protein